MKTMKDGRAAGKMHWEAAGKMKDAKAFSTKPNEQSRCAMLRYVSRVPLLLHNYASSSLHDESDEEALAAFDACEASESLDPSV